ncbi:MAG TPA: DivIVA domain-containing protein [Euzebyales bacterium]|nr:DivIVA domain-containing protein [Euzebyales bacterium]
MGAAHDIRTRDFGTTFVGYDRGQVDAFRDEVAEVIDQLGDRVETLERQLREFERSKPITADQAFAQVARETQRILQVAQDAGARMLQQAREQAESELAVARREHSQIVGEGYRIRDKMGDQLGELDQARSRLLQKLYDASSEIERICAAVESDPPGEARRAVAEQLMEHSRTGTDLARRPMRPGEPALRVVNDDEGARAEPVRPSIGPGRADTSASRADAGSKRAGSGRADAGSGRAEPAAARGGDPLIDKRDELAPLRGALVEGLRRELRVVRDRLREHLRQAGDAKQRADIVLDSAALSSTAEVGTGLLVRAFELGARAAAAELGDAVEPVAADGFDGGVLGDVLDARIGGPIRTVLDNGRAAQDPPWVLSERIDGVISDASEAMVAEIAETELSRAYERGKLATWSEESAARRWILSPRGHRRDDRCRHNAKAGALPPDEPFPSGEHAPPRFSGCTCGTSSAKEENEP